MVEPPVRRYLFLSDVHLRSDRPERGRRLAEFVGGLSPKADHLVIAGDLCDFWMVARQFRRADPLCPGLKALVDFHRAGGELTLLAGNHDAWFAREFREVLGVEFTPEPWTRTVHGLRVHLVHGRRTGARPWWKGLLESRFLFNLFRTLPSFVARWLEFLLDQTNELAHDRSDQKHLLAYRDQAARLSGLADLAVFGHLHRALDDPQVAPRLIVLGGWHHGMSYLVVDEEGARFQIQRDSGRSADQVK